MIKNGLTKTKSVRVDRRRIWSIADGGAMFVFETGICFLQYPKLSPALYCVKNVQNILKCSK